MTKIGIFGTALSAVLLLSSSAHAAQGLFGGRDPQDGSINFRSSTTEQFDPVRGHRLSLVRVLILIQPRLMLVPSSFSLS